jgi:hypothetical protein
MAQCQICGTVGTNRLPDGAGDKVGWDCPRCGKHYLSGTADVILSGLIDRQEINASTLSHLMRAQYDATKKPRTWSERDLEPLKSDKSYTRPQEQFDNLILWIGQNQGAPHAWVSSSMPAMAARVGAAISRDNNTEPGLSWIFKEYGIELFVYRPTQNGSALEYQLKAAGWKYFDDLSRRVVNSHGAFMAMKFGESVLENALTNCFQPAAKRASFALKPLNQQPSAGLIDNQIRAAIRASRFVVADLTHDNNGAYFEAGFAEGLGIPVIYTCEATKFKAHKTHFDTNHMLTVPWDSSNLEQAGRELTATIRNTLPADAKLDD